MIDTDTDGLSAIENEGKRQRSEVGEGERRVSSPGMQGVGFNHD
jgi:hypothetical protein